jgi:hypothetical protein
LGRIAHGHKAAERLLSAATSGDLGNLVIDCGCGAGTSVNAGGLFGIRFPGQLFGSLFQIEVAALPARSVAAIKTFGRTEAVFGVANRYDTDEQKEYNAN